MSIIGIAIGATGLALILVFLWMLSLSLRKKRLEEEKRQRELAYRRALEKNKQRERQERILKAEEGHVPTILFLAKEAERTNIKEALHWYTKAAKLDSINGMYGIVRLSQKMREDLVLKEQAKFWQNCISALEGNASAKYDMALALFHGRGTDQNVLKATSVMQEAAEEKNIDAILFLGEWCVSANNPQRKPQDSTYWYKRAAQLNSLEGRMRLGLNYLHGVGVSADHNKGCYWLERAAEKGHVQAMYHAGEAWMDRGSKGNAIAYIWLFLSAYFGYEPAKALRDQVGANLGVDSVVGLQSLVRPIIKKMAAGTVSKHSVIRVLNKLYKRGIQLPQDATDSELLSDDSELDEELLSRAADTTQSQPQPEPQPPEPESPPPKMDFSAGFKL
ncbi:tetratricopeptide repeat protein [Vibrio sp. V39_P1S14PM300]|uniref:tetratricopeptide repeat protein n=1 Tax=Vibrio sp. V39_P1S14PM300 TaxID=1938690 RepID=UPI001372CA48|nr:tetratricopeptide repeat protein [Vibrio sp. V39_P1S14PM300]NAX19883.1 hypothetical protein [Vibrio sp. V39_P1S14PM300]